MKNVGIVGFGTIGAAVGKSLDEGISGLCLVAVASGRKEKAIEAMKQFSNSVDVDSDSAKFSLKIENVQSESNPGTAKITALGVIACLRGIKALLKLEAR